MASKLLSTDTSTPSRQHLKLWMLTLRASHMRSFRDRSDGMGSRVVAIFHEEWTFRSKRSKKLSSSR
eukprot:608217-Amphidinium_carterae.2